LASVVEAHFDRDAETAAVARNEVAEAETETRRDFVEVDASGAVERVGVTADVVLAVQGICRGIMPSSVCESARQEYFVNPRRRPCGSVRQTNAW
jgi:hypothetical protein